jgi:isochorismate synthase
MNSFAIYRMPHAQCCTLVEGEAVTLPSLATLHTLTGFIVAPFVASPQTPIVVIRPDRPARSVQEGEQIALPTNLFTHLPLGEKLGEGLPTYAADFATFHRALDKGEFQKLVLARQCSVPKRPERHPADVFQLACRLYPRMFIALVSTPITGTWLIASPEILIERNADHWHTIALAGTKREGQQQDWTHKDMKEQRHVATYIAECLKHRAHDIVQEGPYTVGAAHLLHLRTDFTFKLNDGEQLGSVVEALHPTPAVCGLPKAEALHFIVEHEHAPRTYYSGFMGPVAINEGDGPQTHLYVSLRCMQITQHDDRLYAGGGLLPESEEQTEWLETEAKMETMRRLLDVER